MELDIKLPQLLVHLTFYIITWVCLFHLENLELVMVVYVRLHGIEAFAEY